MDDGKLARMRRDVAQRHGRLFDLLKQGDLQANHLDADAPDAAGPLTPSLPSAVQDFAEMARQSLATRRGRFRWR